MNLPAPRIPTGTGWPGARAPHARLVDAWHEQTEWENELNYRLGYTDGYAASCAEIETDLMRALGGASATTFKQAVDNHYRELARNQRRKAADRGELAA